MKLSTRLQYALSVQIVWALVQSFLLVVETHRTTGSDTRTYVCLSSRNDYLSGGLSEEARRPCLSIALQTNWIQHPEKQFNTHLHLLFFPPSDYIKHLTAPWVVLTPMLGTVDLNFSAAQHHPPSSPLNSFTRWFRPMPSTWRKKELTWINKAGGLNQINRDCSGSRR